MNTTVKSSSWSTEYSFSCFNDQQKFELHHTKYGMKIIVTSTRPYHKKILRVASFITMLTVRIQKSHYVVYNQVQKD